MIHPLHHLHLRKRFYTKKEKYPHPNRFKRFFDRLIFFVAVLSPIVTIPQAYEIWVGKDATGVSVLSWSFYVFIALIWLVYGILHREKPIIIANAGFALINIFVVVGAIIYG